MSGALLLHTPPRSRTPAESALGDASSIADICAFAWELGGGAISDILGFPPRAAIPEWAAISGGADSYEVTSEINDEGASRLGAQVGEVIASGKRLKLICHETYGVDVSTVYWHALSQSLGFTEANSQTEVWNQIRSRYGRAGSPITVILGTSRTLSVPPPPVAVSRGSEQETGASSSLRELYRIYGKQNEPSGSFLELKDSAGAKPYTYGTLPAAGGGIAAVHAMLGSPCWRLSEHLATDRRVQAALDKSDLVISLVDELNTWTLDNWLHREIVEAANLRAIPCILISRYSSLNRMEMSELGLQARYLLKSWQEPDVAKTFGRLARTWGNL
ncbi:hypothetical protein [Boudabousia marimammalium]|uniref:Uncharacterized protein n=1 Tax=Boudabousia marimammalium TaxID=156892 RepID=A0A1Q5PR29_9ACTO|nr:hypothetical protein [Boudabousia marimammalium]OKL49929.1 hypothetical protein BM477_03220 [Boudabousia marimammalium]